MDDPGYIGWGPRQLQKYLDDLSDYARSIRPVPGRNVSVNEGPDGTLINAAVSTSAVRNIREPFKIVYLGLADGKAMVGVDNYSQLRRDLFYPSFHMAITGLLTTGDPDIDDDGAFRAVLGDYIYLEITKPDDRHEAAIKHGREWNGWPSAFESTPEDGQTAYRYMLAEIVSNKDRRAGEDIGEDLKIIQIWTGHLALIGAVISNSLYFMTAPAPARASNE